MTGIPMGCRFYLAQVLLEQFSPQRREGAEVTQRNEKMKCRGCELELSESPVRGRTNVERRATISPSDTYPAFQFHLLHFSASPLRLRASAVKTV